MKRILLVAALILSAGLPANAAPTHTVSASGIPAILNGIAAIDLHAVAPFPLGIPAPSGHAVLTLQSTFEPPGPRVVTIEIWCGVVDGHAFYGSGAGSDGQTWHLSLDIGEPLARVGWSTSASHRPCGAPSAFHPLIGAATIAP